MKSINERVGNGDQRLIESREKEEREFLTFNDSAVFSNADN